MNLQRKIETLDLCILIKYKLSTNPIYIIYLKQLNRSTSISVNVVIFSQKTKSTEKIRLYVDSVFQMSIDRVNHINHSQTQNKPCTVELRGVSSGHMQDNVIV